MRNSSVDWIVNAVWGNVGNFYFYTLQATVVTSVTNIDLVILSLYIRSKHANAVFKISRVASNTNILLGIHSLDSG